MPITRTRIGKLSHSDTILYEIYMLRFACSRLIREQWEHERDAWVYLESFLVHYRNLIEFLGKPVNRLRQGDIHITNIWTLEGLAAPNWVNTVQGQGQALFTKYEEQDDRVSRYLQHCTTKRIDAKDWPIDEMNNAIEPLLTQVEGILQPANQLLQPVPAVQIWVPHAASTTVATATTAAVLLPKPTNSIT
jgi:hypothetical protein